MYRLLFPILCFLDNLGIYFKIRDVDYKVQQILNKVILAGYYSEEVDANKSCYMCFALDLAKKADLITSEEAWFVVEEIQRYVGRRQYISHRLRELGYPWWFADRLHIYQHWANRPVIRKKPT